jgi:hypothetical protein
MRVGKDTERTIHSREKNITITMDAILKYTNFVLWESILMILEARGLHLNRGEQTTQTLKRIPL